MIRSIAAEHLDHDPHFRWRGDQVTRIENLSDIVFALALGMMASASAPPTTLDALNGHLLGIAPFAFGFAVLLLIWNEHFIFFRRYNLADGRIVFLNACLLLLVLFIAYPLRFIFDALFGFLLGLGGDWSRMADLGVKNTQEAAKITVYFTGGFACLRGVMALMYAHALSRRDVLELNAAEIALTRRDVWQLRGEIAIAVIALWCAAATPLGPWGAMLLSLNFVLEQIVRLAIPLKRRAAD